MIDYFGIVEAQVFYRNQEHRNLKMYKHLSKDECLALVKLTHSFDMKIEFVRLAYSVLINEIIAFNENWDGQSIDFLSEEDFAELDLEKAILAYIGFVDSMSHEKLEGGVIEDHELAYIRQDWISILDPLLAEPYSSAIRDQDDDRCFDTKGKSILLSKETIETLCKRLTSDAPAMNSGELLAELLYESKRLNLRHLRDEEDSKPVLIGFTEGELGGIYTDMQLNPKEYDPRIFVLLEIKIGYMIVIAGSLTS